MVMGRVTEQQGEKEVVTNGDVTQGSASNDVSGAPAAVEGTAEHTANSHVTV